ncbi:hypothetical protein F751_0630 [Auxenochlorella protothecoides]|uniref:OTU domain-containing protein n=1 Tax=Auxenochlorella protothecoides TaxID=3075 RepID=A0A087SS75_AUXPR|nr:hypothetical protein F751_0630 [Auxenochlorella protothecoides]KFM28579.1 hypothetical protein F751_0630 [Auxenochlorella protothecoides]
MATMPPPSFRVPEPAETRCDPATYPPESRAAINTFCEKITGSLRDVLGPREAFLRSMQLFLVGELPDLPAMRTVADMRARLVATHAPQAPEGEAGLGMQAPPPKNRGKNDPPVVMASTKGRRDLKSLGLSYLDQGPSSVQGPACQQGDGSVQGARLPLVPGLAVEEEAGATREGGEAGATMEGGRAAAPRPMEEEEEGAGPSRPVVEEAAPAPMEVEAAPAEEQQPGPASGHGSQTPPASTGRQQSPGARVAVPAPRPGGADGPPPAGDHGPAAAMVGASTHPDQGEGQAVGRSDVQRVAEALHGKATTRALQMAIAAEDFGATPSGSGPAPQPTPPRVPDPPPRGKGKADATAAGTTASQQPEPGSQPAAAGVQGGVSPVTPLLTPPVEEAGPGQPPDSRAGPAEATRSGLPGPETQATRTPPHSRPEEVAAVPLPGAPDPAWVGVLGLGVTLLPWQHGPLAPMTIVSTPVPEGGAPFRTGLDADYAHPIEYGDGYWGEEAECVPPSPGREAGPALWDPAGLPIPSSREMDLAMAYNLGHPNPYPFTGRAPRSRAQGAPLRPRSPSPPAELPLPFVPGLEPGCYAGSRTLVRAASPPEAVRAAGLVNDVDYESLGYERMDSVEVSGDGNCFLYALSAHLHAQDFHSLAHGKDPTREGLRAPEYLEMMNTRQAQLRRQVCDHIRAACQGDGERGSEFLSVFRHSGMWDHLQPQQARECIGPVGDPAGRTLEDYLWLMGSPSLGVWTPSEFVAEAAKCFRVDILCFVRNLGRPAGRAPVRLDTYLSGAPPGTRVRQVFVEFLHYDGASGHYNALWPRGVPYGPTRFWHRATGPAPSAPVVLLSVSSAASRSSRATESLGPPGEQCLAPVSESREAPSGIPANLKVYSHRAPGETELLSLDPGPRIRKLRKRAGRAADFGPSALLGSLSGGETSDQVFLYVDTAASEGAFRVLFAVLRYCLSDGPAADLGSHVAAGNTGGSVTPSNTQHMRNSLHTRPERACYIPGSGNKLYGRHELRRFADVMQDDRVLEHVLAPESEVVREEVRQLWPTHCRLLVLSFFRRRSLCERRHRPLRCTQHENHANDPTKDQAVGEAHAILGQYLELDTDAADVYGALWIGADLQLGVTRKDDLGQWLFCRADVERLDLRGMPAARFLEPRYMQRAGLALLLPDGLARSQFRGCRANLYNWGGSKVLGVGVEGQTPASEVWAATSPVARRRTPMPEGVCDFLVGRHRRKVLRHGREWAALASSYRGDSVQFIIYNGMPAHVKKTQPIINGSAVHEAISTLVAYGANAHCVVPGTMHKRGEVVVNKLFTALGLMSREGNPLRVELGIPLRAQSGTGGVPPQLTLRQCAANALVAVNERIRALDCTKLRCVPWADMLQIWWAYAKQWKAAHDMLVERPRPFPMPHGVAEHFYRGMGAMTVVLNANLERWHATNWRTIAERTGQLGAPCLDAFRVKVLLGHEAFPVDEMWPLQAHELSRCLAPILKLYAYEALTNTREHTIVHMDLLTFRGHDPDVLPEAHPYVSVLGGLRV